MAEERQYSHGRHVASDALRGLAVGIRGVLEAKRMAREAKSGRERRIADHYVRLKRLDLQERRLAISEGAAETTSVTNAKGEQARLDSLQAEQEHKDEWHKRLAEAYDRLESLYRERNRAAAPKEIEQLDNEIAIEARAVVRLGKNLGYSYPQIEQGLKEREDATVAFEEKSGRIDALDISDEHKAQLHTALDSEYSEYRGEKFFGLGTGEDAKIDEILGQLEAIEKLDETPEHKQELKDSYLNEEFGVDASAAEETVSKEEVLQVLEENKDAFSEAEYAGIKEQIELGVFSINDEADIEDFIKLLAKMGSGSTETDDAVEPSEFVDILVGSWETQPLRSMMQAENLTLEDYVTSVESQLRKRYPELSDEEIGSLMDEFREKADLLAPEIEEEESEGLGNPTPTEDGTFDRAPKETDFKHRDAEGVEHNLHAEAAYMIAIDGWSREKIKAHLQKDYPELSDEQIEAVLNDPEFEYPEDVE